MRDENESAFSSTTPVKSSVASSLAPLQAVRRSGARNSVRMSGLQRMGIPSTMPRTGQETRITASAVNLLPLHAGDLARRAAEADVAPHLRRPQLDPAGAPAGVGLHVPVAAAHHPG